MSESFQGPSPWTLSQLANEDFVQAGAAGLVGLFAIVVAYTRRAEMEWQRVLAEIFLEFALTVSLVFSLRNFKREIQGVFHTRIEITVGLAVCLDQRVSVGTSLFVCFWCFESFCDLVSSDRLPPLSHACLWCCIRAVSLCVLKFLSCSLQSVPPIVRICLC